MPIGLFHYQITVKQSPDSMMTGISPLRLKYINVVLLKQEKY